MERSDADGWQLAGFDGVTVALDLEIDDDLQLESRVYDLIRAVNGLRKDTGLQISDRTKLRLPAVDKELLRYHEWIKEEKLAISVTASGDKIEVESVDHAEPGHRSSALSSQRQYCRRRIRGCPCQCLKNRAASASSGVNRRTHR